MIDFAAVDWNTWGPPLAVMGLGALAGLVMAARSGGRLGADDPVAELEARREVLMARLRSLEADRDKLDPADYAAKKQALVAETAEVLRALDEGPPAPAPEAAPAPASASGSKVLAWGVGLLLFFGVTAYSLQQAAQPRRDGASMTGNQDLGGGGGGSADPEVNAALAAVQEDPQDLEALNLLTRVSIQSNDLQSAMGFLDKARRVNPEDPGVLTHLAALQLVIGRLDESQAQLEKALAVRPGFPEARLWMALVLGNKGEWGAAQAELEAVIGDAAASERDRAEARQLLASLEMAKAQQAMAAAGAQSPGPEAAGPDTPAGPPQVSGQVVAAGDIAPGGVLFVYARASDATRGPPLAAKRVADWSLPLEFSLSASDLVFGGAFPEQFWVHAKISRSGDPMVRSDDDVLSATVGPLSPGSEGVTITLGAPSP